MSVIAARCFTHKLPVLRSGDWSCTRPVSRPVKSTLASRRTRGTPPQAGSRLNRNAQIADDIAAAVSDGRNCLVLTRRVAHLDALDELLLARALSALRLQGGMPAKERRVVIDRPAAATIGDGALVIGTTPFIGEGFDSPALDTLFLAAPISYDRLPVQCAGRILREAPGKRTAVVHDYDDAMVPVLAASLGKQMPGYHALRIDSVADR